MNPTSGAVVASRDLDVRVEAQSFDPTGSWLLQSTAGLRVRSETLAGGKVQELPGSWGATAW